MSYQFDAIGNLTSRRVKFTTLAHSSNFRETYDYDNANRLIGRTISSLAKEPPPPPPPTCGAQPMVTLEKSMQLAISGFTKPPITEPPPTPGPVEPCLANTSVTTQLNSASSYLDDQYLDLPTAFRMSEAYRYDDWGNITYKQYKGNYEYSNAQKNRLTRVSGLSGNRSYHLVYDANGNITYDG